MLEGRHIQDAEEDGGGGLGGGLAAGEAEKVGQGDALVAAELGDGLVAFGAGEHGHDRQGEEGGQGVAAAVARARIGDLGKDLKQGKGG